MIPFVDLQAQYQKLKPEIDAALAEVLANSSFILGPQVAALENDFAAYCGAAHAAGVNSGTSALHLALLAAGVEPGDEVITTPMTFVATAAAICYIGAKPVFVDLDPKSYCIDPKNIEAAITNRTKVIMPVHLYGQPADMDPILEIAGRHGLSVIEDAAQAHGARYKGRRVGAIGKLGCFSFYPGKNLGAYGEGGIVITNDSEMVHTVKMLRDWGQEGKGNHVRLGYNYRLEGIQGAVVGVKLKHLEEWNRLRRAHAALYSELLADAACATPEVMDYAEHVFHVYAVRVQQREEVMQGLQQNDIACGVHYPKPVHLQPAFAYLGYHAGDFPHAEKAASEVLSLPMFPELTSEQIETVCSALKKAL